MKNTSIKIALLLASLTVVALSAQGCSSKKLKPSSYSLEQPIVKSQCNA